jgi:hypothetical protein
MARQERVLVYQQRRQIVEHNGRHRRVARHAVPDSLQTHIGLDSHDDVLALSDYERTEVNGKWQGNAAGDSPHRSDFHVTSAYHGLMKVGCSRTPTSSR